MRTRLFVISSLVVVAVLGASSVNAAHAAPKGPGGISQAPATTTPPQQPKDKLAPKPTPTTTVPGPKGPGDIAPAPKDTKPVVDDAPVVDHQEAAPAEAATAEAATAEAGTAEGVSPIVLVAAAAVVAALLALVVIRFRRASL